MKIFLYSLLILLIFHLVLTADVTHPGSFTGGSFEVVDPDESVTAELKTTVTPTTVGGKSTVTQETPTVTIPTDSSTSQPTTTVTLLTKPEDLTTVTASPLPTLTTIIMPTEVPTTTVTRTSTVVVSTGEVVECEEEASPLKVVKKRDVGSESSRKVYVQPESKLIKKLMITASTTPMIPI